MDVFTGISRNTTSTRFFQTLFNNLVIFHESLIKNSIRAWESFGAWRSSTRFQRFWQISDLLPEGDLWPAAVFSFSAAATCLVLMDIWKTCCVLCCLLLPLLSCVTCVTCACCILCLWIFGHANLHNHSSASLLLFFLLNPNNHRATLSALLCLEKLCLENIATISLPQWLPKVWTQRLLIDN